MAEIGNPYKDNKGHFTKKENDGGDCNHTGFSHKTSFTKQYNTFKDKAVLEAAERFQIGGSGKWEMSDEEKEQARKTLGGKDLTVENIIAWEEEQRKIQKQYAKKYKPTIKDKSPERIAFRKKSVEDEIAKQEKERPIQHDKIALVSLGNAGSGKSSAGGKFFKNQYGAYEVDPDIFKRYTPEFQKDKNMVGIVHKESSEMAYDMWKKAVENGGNIFFPTTGGNKEKLLGRIQELKKAGYKVYLDYIDLDLEENVTRTITRGLAESRYTTSDVIRDSYGQNKDNFDELKDNKELIDGWRLWDNNKGAKIVENGGEQLKKKEDK